MRLKHLASILFLCSPWAAAANYDCSAVSETTPESFDSIRESYGSFAMDLFMEVKDGSPNVFLSPYSVSTALGMTYAGAAGQTAAEMKQALQLTLEDKEAHQAMGSLRQNWRMSFPNSTRSRSPSHIRKCGRATPPAIRAM